MITDQGSKKVYRLEYWVILPQKSRFFDYDIKERFTVEIRVEIKINQTARRVDLICKRSDRDAGRDVPSGICRNG